MKNSLTLPTPHSTGSTVVKLAFLGSLLLGSMWVFGMMLAFAVRAL